jgi:hypothetical protein
MCCARKRRDLQVAERSENNQEQLRKALAWLVDESIFDGVAFHGNTSWIPTDLAVLALLWMWSPARKLTDAFDEAAKQSRQIIGRTALTTFQGFVGALKVWTPVFMPRLQVRLHKKIRETAGCFFREGRWVAIAVDGSRATTPRTVSNEDAFCAKNYGKGNTAKYRKSTNKRMRRRKTKEEKQRGQAPQIWITLMWHIGLGLPWSWKLGPSSASERDHAKELIRDGHFEKNTLFVGDAGFVGYEFWKLILDQSHHFLVRAGGNVYLFRSLGYRVKKEKDIVYFWPKGVMSKRLPPLKLRMVKRRIGGSKVCLLTSVLDPKLLTSNEMVRIYKQRWGVELEFRALKQTFERRKLRSRESTRVLVEMEWSVFAMTAIELFALKTQMHRANADPKKLSFANALGVIRRSLTHLEQCSRKDTLITLLREAKLDDYKRTASKRARYQPNSKHKPSCGQPQFLRATARHRQRWKEIQLKNAA